MMMWAPHLFSLGMPKLAFYLAVILFFAVALRIFCFTGMSGSDDIDYNREAHYVSIGEFESRVLDRSRSPSLYINTLRVGLNFPVALFFRLGGVNEITSILVPFLCSLGLISLSFLGGRLFFDTNTGLMAALLMSLLPIDVRHATKLIPDSPGAFWAGLCMLLFFVAERRKGKPLAALGYTLSGGSLAVSYLTKGSAIFIGVILFSYAIYRLILDRRIKWEYAFCLAGK